MSQFDVAARLLLLAVLVCDCSALLLGAGTPRHFVARDTVTRCGATVQMDLSSLVSDHPLAAIAVTAAVSSAVTAFAYETGALGEFVLPTPGVAMVWRPPSFLEKEPSLEELLVCPHPCAPLCSTHACTSRIG